MTPENRERWRRAQRVRAAWAPSDFSEEEARLEAEILDRVGAGDVTVCPGYHAVPDPYGDFGVPQHPAPELSTYVRN